VTHFVGLALCPNTNEVVIYQKQGTEWKVQTTLKDAWFLPFSKFFLLIAELLA
jgi:hypothetical protein